MEMSLDALESAALDFANALRERHGLVPATALEAGVPASCAGCPIAVTAGGWSPGVAGWEVGRGGAIFVGPKGGVQPKFTTPVPDHALEFMAAFDAGMFPHLTAAPVTA